MELVKDDSSRLRKLVFRYLIRLKLSEKNISELALSDYTDVRQFTMDFILRNYRQDKAILEALYDLMLDEELKIRVAALKAIWQCRTEDRYEILEQSLTDDEPEVRNLAAQLLLSSSEAKAQKIIKTFMKENKKVNISYLQELNTISELQNETRAKKSGWRQKVVAALNHKNLKMKKAAIDIILSNRDAELVSELQKFLSTNRDTELKNYLYRKISQEQN
jgi:HEAT repeat protein